MTDNERLAACEAAIAELRAAVAALQANGAPAALTPPIRPQEAMDEGATIRTEAPGAHFIMPTEPELRALFDIVLAAAPFLHREPGRFDSSDAPFDRFCSAFRAVGAIGRSERIDDGKALTWWEDEAEHILKQQRVYGDVTGPAFTAAVLAHGDVAYRPLDRYPYDLGFGLVLYGGTCAKEAWRRVLSTGRTAAAAPARSIGRQTYAIPPVTIGQP